MLLGTEVGVQLSTEGLIVPERLRLELGRGFVLTKGVDRCVAVFPYPEWEALLRRIEQGKSFLSESSRLFQRHLFGKASADVLDAKGRMSVPEDLRKYAQLGDEVILVGVATRLEIWNPEHWNEEESRIFRRAEQVSEELSDCGI